MIAVSGTTSRTVFQLHNADETWMHVGPSPKKFYMVTADVATQWSSSFMNVGSERKGKMQRHKLYRLISS